MTRLYPVCVAAIFALILLTAFWPIHHTRRGRLGDRLAPAINPSAIKGEPQ